MVYVLLTATVWAQDVPPTIPVSPGDTVTATVPSYLVAEPRWLACIDKAQDLKICKNALGECVGASLPALNEAQKSLRACQAGAGTDRDHILQLMDGRSQDAVKITTLRYQRNVAYVIAGVAVAGLGTTAVVAAR